MSKKQLADLIDTPQIADIDKAVQLIKKSEQEKQDLMLQLENITLL